MKRITDEQLFRLAGDIDDSLLGRDCGWCEDCLIKMAARELWKRRQADERLKEKFGHISGDGKCACAYCVRDFEAVADHAAVLEMELFRLRERAATERTEP